MVLCGQLLKLLTELVDKLQSNSTETTEIVRKIEAITKDLSLNAAKSQKFLEGVKVKTLSEFMSTQEEGIKREVAGRLFSQAEKLQDQLKAKMETAAMLTATGKKFVDFTLNLMTQMQANDTYGAAAEASAHANRHIFDANV
ncbi:MAG: hypothetical protein IKZ58_02870 [Selenomonadaceae bacterium]|nr:hypothetical protein [Selenomonadaceae bacterium]